MNREPKIEDRKSADPRHHPVMVEIDRKYRFFTRSEHAPDGLPMPSPGRVAKALAEFLGENPGWSLEALLRAVVNRFCSAGINPAEEPWCWIKYLPRYVGGALDKWGKPVKPSAGSFELQGATRKPSAEEAERWRVAQAKEFERTFGKRM